MNAQSIYMRFPSGLAKAFTMSFDDGRVKDADIIKVLRNNSIKATFFIPTGMFGKSYTLVANGDACVTQYANKGMEIAAHSRTHPDLPTVYEQKGERGLKEEILDDIATLEKLFGQKVFGLSYPGAPPYKLYDDAVIEFLKKHNVGYARTLHAKIPTFQIPHNWLLWEPTIWIGSVGEIEQLTERFMTATVEAEPMLYNIWGHAYDIDDKWESFEAFERFCQKIGNQKDVWYASYGDIYNYVKAFEKLEAFNNTVTNKAEVALWFECSGKVYKINAGQTINL